MCVSWPEQQPDSNMTSLQCLPKAGLLPWRVRDAARWYQSRIRRQLMGLHIYISQTKPPWSRIAAFLQGKALVSSARQCMWQRTACYFFPILRAGPPHVATPGSYALEKKLAIGLNGMQSCTFKTALERCRGTSLPRDWLLGVQKSCMHACLFA